MSTDARIYAIEPALVATLPIAGSEQLFPVRRVYCVGRNYADHAIEMGGDPDRDPPFFFQKNPENLYSGDTFPYPVASNDVHHEIEMVVALKAGGVNIPASEALDCVFGYAVGLDMTRRDLQAQAKELARPWEVGKAFENSAPCSRLVPIGEIGSLSQGAIWLDVNGQRRQKGNVNQMIWKTPEIISYLSGLFRLSPGDVIMTGTPAGVGPVEPGDMMHGHIDGIGDLEVRVV